MWEVDYIICFVLQCSAQCGLGLQTRKVFCGSWTDEGVQKADDSKCDVADKYEDSKNCTGEEECKGNWFAGPWSTVSTDVPSFKLSLTI